MWSWEHIRYHRNQVKSYKELYKIKITSKKVTQESLFMLEVRGFKSLMFITSYKLFFKDNDGLYIYL